MFRISRDHKGARLHGQQVVFAHQPGHAFVIHQQTLTPQFRGHAAIAVAPPVLQHDLLNRRSYFQLFLHWLLLL
jgi:hypothetical protein